MPSAGTESSALVDLGGLWTRFLPEMERRVAVLRLAGSSAERGCLMEPERSAARRAAHNLAGSLGMLGLERGSVVARELELALEDGTGLRTLAARVSALSAMVAAGPVADTPPPAVQIVAPAAAPSVLVLSANEDFAECLASEAAARGMRTIFAGDAAAARERLVLEAPVALVIDLHGIGDSVDALNLIGEIGCRKRRTPVVVSGAGEGVLDRIRIARLGVSGVHPAGTDPGRLIDAALREVDRGTSIEGARVLAVDDDPVVLALLGHLLEPLGIMLASTSDPLRVWDLLEEDPPDLVIFDVDMPGVDGVELCRALRNDAEVASIPVMFLTGKTDGDTVRRMFAAGADDYVPKPIVGVELITRIGNRLERANLTRRLADNDGLTGLSTRRKAEDLLARFQRLAVRHEKPLTLAMIDVDHFKSVNDSRGHAGGDEVLRRLARLLAEAFRGEDVIARWGGEEFVVGMYDMDRDDGIRRLVEVLAAFRAEQGLTFSAGVSIYPVDGADVESLHRAADAALYLAKASGRNRVLAAGEPARTSPVS